MIAETTGWAWVGWQLLSFAVFAFKGTVLVFIIVQIRWTLPRLRVDQLMVTCWKYLVPMSITMLLGVLILMLVIPQGGIIDKVIRGAMVAVGVVFTVVYVRRVQRTYAVDREAYRKMEGRDLWFPPYKLP